MDSDNELEERFRRAKNILTYVSLPLARLGLWPVDLTTRNHMGFAFYITFQAFHIVMEVVELVMVFDDVQEVIANLMVTSFQCIVAFRALNVRFHPGIRGVILEMKKFHMDHKFDGDEEKRIYVESIEKAERFHRYMLRPAWVSSFVWYTTPIVLHLSTRSNPNNTIPLDHPLRMPPFFDMSNLKMAILVYLLDLPLIFATTIYLSVYSINFAFINGICGRLACLTYKIKNITRKELVGESAFFRGIVEEHSRVIQLAKSLDDSSCILLLIELFNVTLRIVLICYCIITYADTLGFFFLVNYCMYLGLVLLCMYGNCHMGENLLFESVNLFDAYAASNWHEMPRSYQKGFVICMARAQTPLRMTAGKFYVYSLHAFTGILRSCMAYVSMLRTVM